MIDWGECPESGRQDTLLAALRALHAVQPEAAHIVEIGTTRNLTPRACVTDGWATRIFAWYCAQTGGHLTTIDNRTIATKRARQVVGEWAPCVSFVTADARSHVAGLNAIDLLYMDGPSDADVHYDIYRALTTLPPLVLFDDIVLEGVDPNRWPKWPPRGVEAGAWKVKGARAIPAMIDDGYTIEWERGRQVLLRAP